VAFVAGDEDRGVVECVVVDQQAKRIAQASADVKPAVRRAVVDYITIDLDILWVRTAATIIKPYTSVHVISGDDVVPEMDVRRSDTIVVGLVSVNKQHGPLGIMDIIVFDKSIYYITFHKNSRFQSGDAILLPDPDSRRHRKLCGFLLIEAVFAQNQAI